MKNQKLKKYFATITAVAMVMTGGVATVFAETPDFVGRVLSDTEQNSSNTNQDLSNTNQDSSNTNQDSSNTNQDLSNTNQDSSNTNQDSSNTNQDSSNTNQSSGDNNQASSPSVPVYPPVYTESTTSGSVATETTKPSDKNEGVEKTVKEDGTVVEVITETAKDGSKVTTKTETAKDGSSVNVVKTEKKNTVVTVTVKKNADGETEGISEKTTIASIQNKMSASVVVEKNGKGKIKSAKTVITASEDKNSKITLTASTLSKVKDIAGTSNVNIVVKVGKNTKLSINAKEIKAGKTYKVLKLNTKTGKYEKKNVNVKVKANGTIVIPDLGKGTFKIKK